MLRPSELRPWPMPRLEIGRAVARLLCTVLAVLGVLPLLLAVALGATSVRRFVESQTTSLIHRELGVEASYRVRLRMIPIRLEIDDIKLLASDGGEPAFLARRIS